MAGWLANSEEEMINVTHLTVHVTNTSQSAGSVTCTSCLKNIPDISDRNVKKDCPILIIIGTTVSDTTGHQTKVQFPTSPLEVHFCTI